MEYLVTLLFVIFVVICLSFSGSREAARASSGRQNLPPALMARQPSPLETGNLTKEEIRRRLEKISTCSPPRELKTGAMCYAPRLLPERVDYICPLCGQKTLYVSSKGDNIAQMEYIIESLPECRRLAKQAKGVVLHIDEKEFCRKCTPGGATHKLSLVVSYPGEKKEYRVSDVTVDDLRLINEFLEGKDRHRSSNDSESAMKDHLPRLRELLGIGAR
jgi:hypothetical protein